MKYSEHSPCEKDPEILEAATEEAEELFNLVTIDFDDLVALIQDGAAMRTRYHVLLRLIDLNIPKETIQEIMTW
jgi:hypothetical protein